MATRKVFTLAIVREYDRILLGKKKRKLGRGLWNGFGGGVEKGETVKEAAARECEEEVEIIPTDMVQRGFLQFHYPHMPLAAEFHDVHVFEVRAFTGEPTETDEMAPKWFAIEDIPYGNMWEDDRQWLPLLLAGKSFRGSFGFAKDGTLVASNLKEGTYVI